MGAGPQASIADRIKFVSISLDLFYSSRRYDTEHAAWFANAGYLPEVGKVIQKLLLFHQSSGST